MGWFRKSEPRDALAVTMTGVKLGDRFLAIGARDATLVAAIAAKAGLTGRACVVEADAARAESAAAAVEAEGALVEATHAAWDALPYDAGSFDVAMAHDVLSTLTPEVRRNVVTGVLRVLRGGGRLVVVEGTKRARADANLLTSALQDAGFAAVRVLAEADHTIYVEGIKKA